MQEKKMSNNHGEYYAKWRNPLKNKIFIYLIILGIIFLSLAIYSYHPDERLVLYDIMKELKVGMPRKDVLAIIEKYQKSFVHKSSDQMIDKNISLWVYYLGFFYSCHLIIEFSDNKLYSAKIRGENGPHDTFKDAPLDIK